MQKGAISGLQNTPKCVSGRGSTPDPAGGDYETPQSAGDRTARPIPHPVGTWLRLRPRRFSHLLRLPRITSTWGMSPNIEAMSHHHPKYFFTITASASRRMLSVRLISKKYMHSFWTTRGSIFAMYAKQCRRAVFIGLPCSLYEY